MGHLPQRPIRGGDGSNEALAVSALRPCERSLRSTDEALVGLAPAPCHGPTAFTCVATDGVAGPRFPVSVQVTNAAGDYTFSLTADDGVRLLVWRR